MEGHANKGNTRHGSGWAWEGVTDKEIMRHRFSRKNVKKSARALAKTLGMELEEYEAACEREMEEKAAQWKEFLENI